MKESGYDDYTRLEVIKLGVEAYERQVQRENDGTCPMYRPKGYEKASREKKKLRNKMSWSKPHDSVIFCPPTPNSVLAKKLGEVVQETKQNSGVDIKVVERAGLKMRSLMPGLKKQDKCSRDDCLIHANGGRGPCNKPGVVYRGQCITCKESGTSAIYIGESSRSGYKRGREHLAAMRNPGRYQSNAFSKHIREVHGGNPDSTKFKMDIIRSYDKPLERQVREGVEIFNNRCDIVMNSKLDYFQPGLRRVTFSDMFDE